MFFLFDQLSIVVILEHLLMEEEPPVSSPLVEQSDIDVMWDINYQGHRVEHVKYQEDGLVIKLYVTLKVKL